MTKLLKQPSDKALAQSVIAAGSGAPAFEEQLRARLERENAAETAIWGEWHKTQKAVRDLRRQDKPVDPTARQIASMELQSLKHQAGLATALKGQRVMDEHQPIGFYHGFFFHDLAFSPFKGIATSWNETILYPPWNYVWVAGAPAAGGPGTMVGNQKTGAMHLSMQTSDYPDSGDGLPIPVDVGFTARFKPSPPLNPALAMATDPSSPPASRRGYLRFLPVFSSTSAAWALGSRNMLARSRASILYTFTNGSAWQDLVMESKTLWNEKLMSASPDQAQIDFEPAPLDNLASPWFAFDTPDECSVTIQVSIAVTGDEDLDEYAFAFGSIATVLGAIRVQQYFV